MKRWKSRCARCGNPRHFLRFYVRGWLVWHLFVRWWPMAWGIPPLLGATGDYAFDHRQCEYSCGPETYVDFPDEAAA